MCEEGVFLHCRYLPIPPSWVLHVTKICVLVWSAYCAIGTQHVCSVQCPATDNITGRRAVSCDPSEFGSILLVAEVLETASARRPLTGRASRIRQSSTHRWFGSQATICEICSSWQTPDATEAQLLTGVGLSGEVSSLWQQGTPITMGKCL